MSDSSPCKPRTVEQIHAGLFWAKGAASDYVCVSCGKDAQVWAYQYPEEGELVSPAGTRYSEDFFDYAPMCRNCHFHFDGTKDPNLAEQRRQAQANGGRATKALLQSDPERLAVLQGNLEAGWRSDVKCGSCDYVSNPGAVGSHKKRTGHV